MSRPQLMPYKILFQVNYKTFFLSTTQKRNELIEQNSSERRPLSDKQIRALPSLGKSSNESVKNQSKGGKFQLARSKSDKENLSQTENDKNNKSSHDKTAHKSSVYDFNQSNQMSHLNNRSKQDAYQSRTGPIIADVQSLMQNHEIESQMSDTRNLKNKTRTIIIHDDLSEATSVNKFQKSRTILSDCESLELNDNVETKENNKPRTFIEETKDLSENEEIVKPVVNKSKRKIDESDEDDVSFEDKSLKTGPKTMDTPSNDVSSKKSKKIIDDHDEIDEEPHQLSLRQQEPIKITKSKIQISRIPIENQDKLLTSDQVVHSTPAHTSASSFEISAGKELMPPPPLPAFSTKTNENQDEKPLSQSKRRISLRNMTLNETNDESELVWSQSKTFLKKNTSSTSVNITAGLTLSHNDRSRASELFLPKVKRNEELDDEPDEEILAKKSSKKTKQETVKKDELKKSTKQDKVDAEEDDLRPKRSLRKSKKTDELEIDEPRDVVNKRTRSRSSKTTVDDVVMRDESKETQYREETEINEKVTRSKKKPVQNLDDNLSKNKKETKPKEVVNEAKSSTTKKQKVVLNIESEVVNNPIEENLNVSMHQDLDEPISPVVQNKPNEKGKVLNVVTIKIG